MKEIIKTVIVFGVLLAMLAVLAATNPSEKEHKTAVSEYYYKELFEHIMPCSIFDSGSVWSNQLRYKNCFLFSLGYWNDDLVTVGALHRVKVRDIWGEEADREQ